MKVLKLIAKPIGVSAIKWENNEAEIREFVQDDNNLKFHDRGLMIWNFVEQSWIDVQPLHYIVKGIKGELTCESPEMLERKFSIQTE